MKRLLLIACLFAAGCTGTDGTPVAKTPKKNVQKPSEDFAQLAAFLAEDRAARDGSPQQQTDFAKKWVGKRVSFCGLIQDQWQDQHSRMVRVTPSSDRYSPHLTVFFLPDEFPPMRIYDSATAFECIITGFNPLGCIAESVKRYEATHK